MIIVGEAVDRSGLTVNADIILTAFLAFFRHAQAAELPYGPLLGHAWISGTKFYVPAESTYPCPVAKSPATEWTVIVEDSTVGGGGDWRIPRWGGGVAGIAVKSARSAHGGTCPGRVPCFRGAGRAADSANA
jgi:hypothetical protein